MQNKMSVVSLKFPFKTLKSQNIVIFLFKVLRMSQHVSNRMVAKRNFPRTRLLPWREESTVQINSNLAIIAYILQVFHQLLRSLYYRRKSRQFRYLSTKPRENEKGSVTSAGKRHSNYKDGQELGFDPLPRSHWQNDYAIILVHGFAGWVPDESLFFGDYWKYTSDPMIAKHHSIY